jgi:hypothetical protein
LDFTKRLREQISRTIKKSPLSRDEIIIKMSELTGKSISAHRLNNWTAESKPGHYFPAEFIPAFIMATADYALLDFICSELGGTFIKIDELSKEYRKIESDIRQLEARKIELAKLLRTAQEERENNNGG